MTSIGTHLSHAVWFLRQLVQASFTCFRFRVLGAASWAERREGKSADGSISPWIKGLPGREDAYSRACAGSGDRTGRPAIRRAQENRLRVAQLAMPATGIGVAKAGSRAERTAREVRRQIGRGRVVAALKFHAESGMHDLDDANKASVGRTSLDCGSTRSKPARGAGGARSSEAV